MTVLTEPTKSLREVSREVTKEELGTRAFQAFLDDLAETMEKTHGVGIAAPQVGKNVRAIAMQITSKTEWYINPKIVKKSETEVESEEGCLSVPGKFGIVKRHKRVCVEALNRHGRRVTLDLNRLPSIVAQHEIDHLDGILFIDKVIRFTVDNGKTQI